MMVVMWLERQYINKISHNLRNFKQKGNSVWNFSCPFCGDSKHDHTKARGYIFCVGSDYFYKCHNCNKPMRFESFLQQLFPTDANAYKLEKFRSGGGTLVEADSTIKLFEKKKAEADSSPLLDRMMDRVDQLPLEHPVVQYVKSRRIPESRWHLLYYIDDLGKINSIKEKFNLTKTDPRLILPFFARSGKMLGFTARSLDPESTKKYFAIRMNKEVPFVYGMERVNLNKKIPVVEGPIDSLFLPNAIAAGNADFRPALNLIPKANSISILDNQPRNKEVFAMYMLLANEGYSVFVWPSDFPYKDVNESIQNGVTLKEILDMVRSNTYNGMMLKLKLAEWRKI